MMANRQAKWLALIGSLSLCLLGAQGASPEGKVDFSKDVLPILSDKCFHCHGPDDEGRKAKLRLDTEEGAFRVNKGVANIVKGKPDQSEMIVRILSKDEDDVMPPPSSHRTLTEAQKETLKRWVEQGAPWGKHWAYTEIAKVTPPKVKNTRAVKNEIDQFILARLEKEKLKLSTEATKEQLIRRATFDLTGLPPTLAEIDAFLSDKSPKAYEKVIDRLLQSPAYGEQMAREWLDLARYADTFGYQADVDMNMYPWRDWVIKAYNENLPYDKFITWQLAGDLLPKPTRDQYLATAFNRLHRQTNEGGSIDEEFRVEYVSDRVHTMGTAFLSLTLECARCHDHKYDPISQKDYYSLSAFFDNIDESGLYSHFTKATPTPALSLYKDDQEEKHKKLKSFISVHEVQLELMKGEARTRFEKWKNPGVAMPEVKPVARFALDEIKDNKTPNAVGTNVAVLMDAPKAVAGKVGQALQFSGDNEVECKGVGEFKRTDSFSFTLWVKPTEKQPRAVVFHRSRAWSDSGSRGYELVLEDGKPFFGLIHFWPGDAIGVRAKEMLPLNEWSHLTVTYDGSSKAAGVTFYVNGKKQAMDTVRDGLTQDIIHRAEWGDADAGNTPLTLAGRFRDNGFKNGMIDEFTVYDTALTELEVTSLLATEPQVTADDSLFAYYLNRHDAEYRQAQVELKKLREEENALANNVQQIMIMKELPKARPTYLLKRGAYDAPGDEVFPGTPERIFAMPKEYPKNRLGLAQWMTDPRNPLTARVAVNRIWKLHFGRGLVSTVEDFGAQSQRPTHPELLDWLSRKFMETGWDRKAMHKLILMSATYRQTSVPSEEQVAKDPENLLLARGARHRLAAEQIRDEALAVSGLLNQTIGGQSVKPYQPAGLWEEAGTGKTYVQDKGEKLYRRSLYTFWRRTSPPPSMVSFDATTREVCTAKRETTSTPLQALVLLNDPQFVEASRVLAEKLVKAEPLAVEKRIVNGFRLLTSREPDKAEVKILQELFAEQKARFAKNTEAAQKLLKTGEAKADATLDVADVAATTMLVSVVMNFDEFVMKR
ncbi:MAG TPA: DUF1553 domain-containing protein [Verrucomicrobiae bacterium]